MSKSLPRLMGQSGGTRKSVRNQSYPLLCYPIQMETEGGNAKTTSCGISKKRDEVKHG